MKESRRQWTLARTRRAAVSLPLIFDSDKLLPSVIVVTPPWPAPAPALARPPCTRGTGYRSPHAGHLITCFNQRAAEVAPKTLVHSGESAAAPALALPRYSLYEDD
ncbi:hypothetical protein JYU34_008394 [Plutella xylostella]|uniref:Uncharacterized protein n=1 Tax=Plutella xylostella TaxID=51655 RepID=A0ABQ7QLD1_PLUXY|nr:hypothetical protein JYU34_008394 [Plutella xylostella]